MVALASRRARASGASLPVWAAMPVPACGIWLRTGAMARIAANATSVAVPAARIGRIMAGSTSWDKE